MGEIVITHNMIKKALAEPRANESTPNSFLIFPPEEAARLGLENDMILAGHRVRIALPDILTLNKLVERIIANQT